MIDYSKEYRENIKDSKKFNLDYTRDCRLILSAVLVLS